MKKKTLSLAVVLAVALALLFASAAYAAPASQGDLPDDLTPIAAWLFLVSLVLPPINALIKRATAHWSKESQSVLILFICTVAGAGQAFFNGSLKWANGDLRATAGLVVINIAIVTSFAYTWYKNLYQATGIDAKISGS